MSDPNYLLRDDGSEFDFRDYRTAADHSIAINRGCDAALRGIEDCPYAPETGDAKAWHFGHAQGAKR